MEAARAVELPDGDEVEQVEERGELRDRAPDRRAGREEHAGRDERRAEPVDRSGEPDLRVDHRVVDPLLQHHERPDGTGFPLGIIGTKIAPLAALHIIVHDIVQAFLRENIPPEKFVVERKQYYLVGAFRQIIEKLSSEAGG